MVSGRPIVDLLEHFDSKLIVGHDGGHWSLDSFVNNKGYHTISVGDGRKSYGHIVAYELTHGPVPVGLEVDHLCRTTWCCNPVHLEAVTHAENLRRAHPLCGAGLHDLTDPANRYVRPGSSTAGGMCRPCMTRRNRARRNKSTTTEEAQQ